MYHSLLCGSYNDITWRITPAWTLPYCFQIGSNMSLPENNSLSSRCAWCIAEILKKKKCEVWQRMEGTTNYFRDEAGI